ncbi:tetratricopeptide repeat protein [Azospirillum doebereinerae]|uniref:Tetratricopeptide repeat protein n=1 Tax=Azospirillum doebereinerae TaxID=92933 RepID=A0A433J8T5_9PROT|nr:tetratricopeptide repeat protein [Azospirillum doebereinerae]MCG5243198.1 tetratricopeptide repeat protein [Azospirillum doebereinerae]RUQ70754.1 tetratricopeptide repeat protein [Azospirillum doebereinerae]
MMIRRFFSLTVLLLLTVGAPAGAGQGNLRLDALFQALRATSDEAYAESVEEHIWDSWLEHPNGDMIRVMRDGVLSLNADDYAGALDAFNTVIATDPTYAEGWNKRANVYYMLGDYRAAVDDLRHTLLLEPRHFGALTGLGLVYLALNQPQPALRALDAALVLNPHLVKVRQQADSIRTQLSGLAL